MWIVSREEEGLPAICLIHNCIRHTASFNCHFSEMPTIRSVGDASLINTAALIVTNGGVEPPRGEAERSARTTCYTPMVANPSLACHQARLSRAARQARP